MKKTTTEIFKQFKEEEVYMAKWIQLFGILMTMNVVSFIVFSKDFYGQYTLIPYPLFYGSVVLVTILGATRGLMHILHIERKYVWIVFVASMVIYRGVPAGLRAFGDDVLRHYYTTTDYSTLGGLNHYTQMRGNLLTVKWEAFKEKLWPKSITQGLSSQFVAEEMHDIEPAFYEEVVYRVDNRTYFIYDWTTQKIIATQTTEELREEVLEKLGISHLENNQSLSMYDKVVRLHTGEGTSEDYYLIPKEGVFTIEEMPMPKAIKP